MLSNPNTSLAEIQAKLQGHFPEYRISLRKNVFGDFVMVAKTKFIGAMVQLRKDQQVIVQFAIPSVLVQVFFGGLLFFAFTYSKLKKMENEVGEFVMQSYGLQ